MNATGTALSPESSRAELLHVYDLALRQYHHAEATVQARLYNFLFADSIVLLSWATVYVARDMLAGKRFVLCLFALVSAVFGTLWALMGVRHLKFYRVLTEIIEGAQAPLPPEWRVREKVIQLQHGEPLAVRGKCLQVAFRDKIVGSRYAAVVAPSAMAIVSAILFFVSLRG